MIKLFGRFLLAILVMTIAFFHDVWYGVLTVAHFKLGMKRISYWVKYGEWNC